MLLVMLYVLGIIYGIILFCAIISFITRGKSKSSVCLVGKTAIVTGGNSGIGYQVCLNLASRGCKVIIADVNKSDEPKNNLIKYTNNENIVRKFVDLASFESIRTFADDIKSSESKIDILINNAGIGCDDGTITEDGIGTTSQVNYFGTFLLTHLLIDLLKKAAPSRIVFVSSCMSLFSYLKPEELALPKSRHTFFGKVFTYCNTKMAVILESEILAEKLAGTGVTSNSIHPGYVWQTAIFGKLPTAHPTFFVTIIFYFMIALGRIVGKDAWDGAQTTTHVAVSKSLEKVTGKYFWDCKPAYRPIQSPSKEQARVLWQISEELVGLKENEKL